MKPNLTLQPTPKNGAFVQSAAAGDVYQALQRPVC